MGWLENLIAGLGSGQGYQPPFGSEGVGGGIEDLRTQIQRMLEAQKAPLSASVAEMDSDPGALDVFKRAASVATGGKLGFDPSGEDPMHIRAQEKIAELSAQKEMARQEDEETKRMQEDAMQRSLDPLTWAGGGGPDSGKQYPADKLFAIREQARAMGGGGGLSTGGGSFSQQADSPELQARLRERDEWTAGQPERDLAFATTPEQTRRNPQYAATAADSLAQLQQTNIMERKTANQEALIASLTKGGGKVPFETAMKLDAAGMPVPTFAIGRSPDQAKREFAEIKRGTLQDLQNAEISGLSQGEIAFLSYVLSAQMDIEGRIKAGEDPVKLLIELEKIIDFHADSSGARVAAQQRAASMKAAQEVK